LVEFFAAVIGVDPHLWKQGALGLPQFGFRCAPVCSGFADARVALGSLAQRVIDGKRLGRARRGGSQKEAHNRKIRRFHLPRPALI
jgi:hypothetical protein